MTMHLQVKKLDLHIFTNPGSPKELSNSFLLSLPDGIKSLTPSGSIFFNYLPFNIKSGKGKKFDFREIPTDLPLLRMFGNTQKIRFLLQIVLEISYFQELYKMICQDDLP